MFDVQSTDPVIGILTRVRDARLARYLVASVGALAVDMGSFLALLTLGIWSAPASAAGYSLGILAHWLLSSRTVFSDAVAPRGFVRTRQKALFVASALVGLTVTIGIVGLGDLAGLDPRIAKGVAIATSFVLTWMLRSRIVFRAGEA
jgi:putative flippase GtrA